MNRLLTRLSLAMIAVALITAFIITAGQRIAFELDFRTLPEDVQARMIERREREETENSEMAERFRKSHQLQQRFLYGGVGIAALVAAGIAVMFARSISKPIERVMSVSAKVARGDLSARILERSVYSSLEAKALTDNFNQMASALESYEKERRDMIASIAHDLRTPLTAMQLRLEALKEELIPLSQEEVSLLLSQTELLERLISDLRTLSLADAGKLSLHKEDTNVVQLVETVLGNFEQKAQAKMIHLYLQSSAPVIQASVDPARLMQMLSNLLDNALRFGERGTQILVKLDKLDNAFELSVQDEGPGIPEGLLPHIFQRYIQDKDTGGSSGLGLAIVKTLVDLHGGKVSAKNLIPKGALFSLSLPLGANS
ncbi:MAG: HAMP domain-containing protein [Trueperaceae bacterium]|nr:HAMP domain-containing protein [Trueperaceae bacterium]